jgi:hypothetical protein
MRTIALTLIATEMVVLTSMTAFGDPPNRLTIQSVDPNETVSDVFKNSPSGSTCVIIHHPPQPDKTVCNWKVITPAAINGLLKSQPK